MAAEHRMACSSPDVIAVTQSREFAEMICVAVSRAKPILARCHLTQTHRLEILEQEAAELGGFMAHYSPRQDKISVVLPKSLHLTLADDSAYRAIPSDQLFESIVFHELAHAFFAKTECGLQTCRAGHEYIAFAMQLASLPSESRSGFLDVYPSESDVELADFSERNLDLAPERFAADAWRHFSSPDVGCEFIKTILSGEVTFPSENE